MGLRQYLAVIPDKPGALATRLAVRPSHLAEIAKNIEPTTDGSPYLAFAGGLFEDHVAEGEVPAFVGSSVSVMAKSKTDAIEFLAKDVYNQNGVWDMSKIQIYGFGAFKK